MESSRSYSSSDYPESTSPRKETATESTTNGHPSEESSRPTTQRLDDTHLDALYRFALTLALTEQTTEQLLRETYRRVSRELESNQPGNENKRKQELFSTLITIYKRDHMPPGTIPVGPRSEEPRPQAFPLDRVSLNIMNDLDETFFSNISDDEVDNSLKHLPEICRICIYLADVEGFSHDEVGAILDCSADTVQSQLHQGRNLLKRKLIRSEVSKGVLPTP